ncbi:Type IV fimbrial biogenesis protein PilV [Pseudoalteromonas luteoviolacea B = ATCC 29581]|nr:Type IV fimbrial biogenesis protein PilV [Pseudoalteromonas luteoviolacea B = ATCC 29581]
MRLIAPKYGFSLLEVMISIVVAGVALLGLAATQLKTLQLSTNSYFYTLALIQGQNAIERLWVEQCELQHSDVAKYQDANFQNSLKPADSRFSLNLPAAFSKEMSVAVSWADERMADQAMNQIRLSVSFPTMPSSCI